ncbi:MAG: CCA tRNA nucleotidyltransferase [Thermofilaceae archaeon]|nr:CCA tRNA nucleotidyltransferase [Thermofilaceae archaeon]
MKTIEEILKQVSEKVTPSLEEKILIASAVDATVNALRKAARELEVDVEVEVEGSFAKDTWLSGDVDVDIFLLFNPTVPLEELRYNGLRIAKRGAELIRATWTERYASHPYLTLNLDVCNVDVVPAYRVASPAQIVSPVDRTPFHTLYVKNKLKANPELIKEVRLLKRFAKGVDVYGAEIKVEGFSGYLIELLVIHYGSFLSVLEAAARWKPWVTILDPEKHYTDPREVLKKFREPFVVIDPVDSNRNVASPVSLENFCKFIAASRAFLREPGIHFFYPTPLWSQNLQEELKQRPVAAVKLTVPQLPEDVLWGQAKRAVKALCKGLQRMGFVVFDKGIWTDGKTLVLVFELESLELPILEKHYGPPVYSNHDARFVSKYKGGNCVAGPYVEGEKWVVVRHRKIRGVREALAKLISSYNIGSFISSSAKEGGELYLGEEVARASESEGYRSFLSEWLARRYPWLR